MIIGFTADVMKQLMAVNGLREMAVVVGDDVEIADVNPDSKQMIATTIDGKGERIFGC